MIVFSYLSSCICRAVAKFNRKTRAYYCTSGLSQSLPILFVHIATRAFFAACKLHKAKSLRLANTSETGSQRLKSAQRARGTPSASKMGKSCNLSMP